MPELNLYRELPIPDHYAADRVDQIWRVPYQQRAVEAEQWRDDFRIPDVDQDQTRIALVVIDFQNTFSIPGFELFVAGRSGNGAVEDSKKLCEFIYRNLGRITHITATLDTHQVIHIFHPIFLVDEGDNHPDPYLQINSQEVLSGKWRINPAIVRRLGLSEDYAARYLRFYARALEEKEKYALTVWPYHAMLGSIGHALVSAIEEALFFYSVARFSQPTIEVKGTNPLTEHYSALSVEIDHGPDGELIDQTKSEIIDNVRTFDCVLIAGQAKSHCVAWTVADLLDQIQRENPELARKVYLLEDCTSPVVVPGADYTDEANEAFSLFAAAGINLVRSTDPIDTWPGLP